MNYTITIAIAVIIAIIITYNYYNFNTITDLVSTDDSAVFSDKDIPKIIIQTWKTNDVPQRYMPLIDSVKTNNPDYEHLFFTDESIEKFFKLHYPGYWNTYNNLPVKIQKIDFFRYVAVYHYGGFYLDLDVSVMKPFDPLLKYSCVFPVDEYIDTRFCKHARYKPYCDRGHNFLLGQYAFAASPKNPFIKNLIDRIHNNLNKYIRQVDFNSEDYIYKTTGPDFVTDVYLDYKNKATIKILDNGRRQYFGDYARHNYFGTWK
jgi:mannosyltransferase OCH1-like enzyme